MRIIHINKSMYLVFAKLQTLFYWQILKRIEKTVILRWISTEALYFRLRFHFMDFVKSVIHWFCQNNAEVNTI